MSAAVPDLDDATALLTEVLHGQADVEGVRRGVRFRVVSWQADTARIVLTQTGPAGSAPTASTPEYAGTLPGSFKNLLDWTVGGGELYGKPAAWLNVAAPGRGGGAAATLASVLSYVGADVIESACRDIPVPRTAVTPDGTVRDPPFASTVADVWAALLARLGGPS